MSLVSEIKCARCDRKYSGVRSRCPYCGARRIDRGKYTEDSDNAKGKMLISILILGCLVVAAGVLLFSTDIDAGATSPPSIAETDPGLTDPEDNITSLPGVGQGTTRPQYEEEEPYEPEEPEAPEVRSISVRTQHGRFPTDSQGRGDASINVGEVLNMTVNIEPIGVEAEVIWDSGSSFFEIVPTSADGTTARLTGVSRGSGDFTVSVGGVNFAGTVRVR